MADSNLLQEIDCLKQYCSMHWIIIEMGNSSAAISVRVIAVILATRLAETTVSVSMQRS